MSKSKKLTIEVQGASVAVLSQNQQDIICLTDIAKFKNPDHPDDVIRNWLRSRNTVEFLGIWERLNNPGFNPVEFDGIRMQTGLNSFVLTPKQWIEKTRAAATRHDANRAFDHFLVSYAAKYPKAAEKLTADRHSLLAFYDFPAEHWQHIRTTNAIESTFATVTGTERCHPRTGRVSDPR